MMAAEMTRFSFLGLATLALHVAATAQQRSDVSFTPKISRPAYSVAGPVVAVDQAHNNFHTLSGRYAPLGQLLAADGYRVEISTQQFSPQTLTGVNVLVIANARGPTPGASAFDSDEMAAIRAWVEGGGSLFLISDQAPFGTAAARLAETLGVNMGVGYVASQDHGRITSQILFRKNGLTSHPIMDGRDTSERASSVRSYTGQSLGIPARGTGLLLLPTDALEVEGQSQVAALSRGEKVPARPASGRAQAVAFNLGRGQVVIAGEAAMFTKQIIPGIGRVGLSAEDDQQFNLNILHWLSHLIGQNESTP
jgi:hypothetical protein